MMVEERKKEVPVQKVAMALLWREEEIIWGLGKLG